MNEAMKQAWLEISQMLGEPTREELDVFLRTWQRATEAHKKALAEQPAQQEYERGVIDGMQEQMRRSVDRAVNAMAQRKPLTDEQIMAIGKELGLKCRLGGNPNIDFDYARAIEAAHGIKEDT